MLKIKCLVGWCLVCVVSFGDVPAIGQLKQFLLPLEI